MSEPEYIRGTGEPMTATETRAWFRAAADEARSEGAPFLRFSHHPVNTSILLVEGWVARPDDMGDPRFALTLDDAP